MLDADAMHSEDGGPFILALFRKLALQKLETFTDYTLQRLHVDGRKLVMQHLLF